MRGRNARVGSLANPRTMLTNLKTFEVWQLVTLASVCSSRLENRCGHLEELGSWRSRCFATSTVRELRNRFIVRLVLVGLEKLWKSC